MDRALGGSSTLAYAPIGDAPSASGFAFSGARSVRRTTRPTSPEPSLRSLRAWQRLATGDVTAQAALGAAGR